MKKSQEYKIIADMIRDLHKAELEVEKTSERRRQLPPGSTRARVTTANARWMAAAEWRDLLIGNIESAGIDIRSIRAPEVNK